MLGVPQRASPLGLVALDQRGEGPLGRNGLGSRRYLATSRVTRGPDAVPPTEPINELISELPTLPTFSPEVIKLHLIASHAPDIVWSRSPWGAS